MDDFVAKPVELAQLQAIVRKWMPVEFPLASAPNPGEGKTPADGKKPASEQEPVDIARLKEMTGESDAEFLAEMLAFFLETVADTPRKLQNLIAAKDSSELRVVAHDAKGAAMYASAPRLAEFLRQLEMAAVDGDWLKIERLAPLIKDQFAEVESFIRGLSSADI